MSRTVWAYETRIQTVRKLPIAYRYLKRRGEGLWNAAGAGCRRALGRGSCPKSMSAFPPYYGSGRHGCRVATVACSCEKGRVHSGHAGVLR